MFFVYDLCSAVTPDIALAPHRPIPPVIVTAITPQIRPVFIWAVPIVTGPSQATVADGPTLPRCRTMPESFQEASVLGDRLARGGLVCLAVLGR